ncbi:MAG TPA: thiamine pyrophosphate-dependent enzyme [Melioribacteraceae bacterium]|nr:thiamine pyrophosphate-dependent enzyme [Melioribacteraceae bacterium]
MFFRAKEVVAQVLIDLGVKIVTYVPGHGASDVYDSYCEKIQKIPILSFHEETAYSIAHGGSIVGHRTAVLMKAQGFMKAANAVTDSQYAQNCAGFVTFIFDDTIGSNSDNILEINPILKGMYFPFKVVNVETLYDDIIKAYLFSEQNKRPVAVIIDCKLIDKKVELKQNLNLKKQFKYERNILNSVVSPLFADYQYKIFKAKNNNIDIKTIDLPNIPIMPNGINEKYKAAISKYIPFFDVFKQYKGDVVTGDTSTSSNFALPPYNCIDIVTHIGGSIPLAGGVYMAGYKNVWALTGDFGFISAGHIGLLDIFNRQLPIKIVIFYNKEASATGGQKIPKNLLKHLLAGYNNYILHISNPNDPIELNKVISEANNSDTIKIIIVDF